MSTDSVDWQKLFEEQVTKNKHLEGQVGNLRASVRDLSSINLDDRKAIHRAAQFKGRVNDMRRGIAARLFAAMIIRDGLPDGDGMYEMADKATDAADALIDSMRITGNGKTIE